MKIKVAEKKQDAAGRDKSTYSIDGVGAYGKAELAQKVVEGLLATLLEKQSLKEAIADINEKTKCKGRALVLAAQGDTKYKETKVSAKGKVVTVFTDNGWSTEETEKFIDMVNKNFGKTSASSPAKAETKPAKADAKSAKQATKPVKEKTASKTPTLDMDKLIDAVLADGKVTDKERAVLLKKAKAAGIDEDEFEIYLDGKIAAGKKSAKKNDEPKAEKKPKSKDPFEGLMVKVEGGIFTQSKHWQESYEYQPDDHRKKPETRYRDCGYTRQVKVSDFQICKYQVTQKQWKAVMGGFPQPQKWEGDDLPVHYVSWDDCQQFIEKLNKLTGKNYHLPTEAQWEFAARGGVKTHNYKYAGSDNVDEVAWHSGNSWQRVQPVGQKKANELGLFDMSGNVWEWCFDWYTSNLGSTNIQDPTGPSSGSYRVRCGGSWYSSAGRCEVSSRGYDPPSHRSYYLGFRIAL